jgi:hypothetical protein
MTPTSRTLDELRRMGYTPAVVERWNPWAKIRQDLYGFIDILAVKEGETGVLAVQTTTTDHAANRMDKAKASPNLRVWLSCGNRFEVWGWAKRGGRGERKTWTLDRRTTEEHLTRSAGKGYSGRA